MPDIKDIYVYMYYIIEKNDNSWQHAGPGGWNGVESSSFGIVIDNIFICKDPDMLEVGNGKMNHEEYKTHFSLWCLAKVFITFLFK